MSSTNQNEVSVGSEVQARKDLDNKAPLEWLPFDALEEVAYAMAFGVKKYGPHNWRKGQSWIKYTAAALRHIFKWAGGEKYAKDSSCHHLAHAVANLLMIITWQEEEVGTDDRYTASLSRRTD